MQYWILTHSALDGILLFQGREYRFRGRGDLQRQNSSFMEDFAESSLLSHYSNDKQEHGCMGEKLWGVGIRSTLQSSERLFDQWSRQQHRVNILQYLLINASPVFAVFLREGSFCASQSKTFKAGVSSNSWSVESFWFSTIL